MLQIKLVPLGRDAGFFFFFLMVCFSHWAKSLSQSSGSGGETISCFSLSKTSTLGGKHLVEGEQ